MGHDDAVNCIAISPDGRYLASAGKSCVCAIRSITQLRFLVLRVRSRQIDQTLGPFLRSSDQDDDWAYTTNSLAELQRRVFSDCERKFRLHRSSVGRKDNGGQKDRTRST
jgi:WD40 repeat protein